MTYVAYGPLGPRLALAVSERPRRTGGGSARCSSATSPSSTPTSSLFPNKDAVFFPEPVPGPDGGRRYAMLHRPMWDLGWFRDGRDRASARRRHRRPARASGSPTCRPTRVEADIRALARPAQTTGCVALPEYPCEALKIGAGPPPIRVDEGWLLIHHGVTGYIPEGLDPTAQKVEYAAGAMILDADDPCQGARAHHRAAAGAGDRRRSATAPCPNVVFPTAIEEIDGVALRLLRHGRREDRRRPARPDTRDGRARASAWSAAGGFARFLAGRGR